MVNVVVARDLDRERTDNYELVVIAIDKGSPALTGTLYTLYTLYHSINLSNFFEL